MLDELQPAAVSRLNITVARARQVVDPQLLGLVEARVSLRLEGIGPDAGDQELTARDRDCLAVVDQMLVDVANLSDDTAMAASRHFPDGGFSDFVTAAYLTEAQARLRIASGLLLGGRP